jgi:serine/threonine protein kinase
MDSESVVIVSDSFPSARDKVLATVSSMHDLGWLHDDLKPDNMAVDSKGVVKIIDFSHACKTTKDSGKTKELKELKRMLKWMSRKE